MVNLSKICFLLSIIFSGIEKIKIKYYFKAFFDLQKPKASQQNYLSDTI